MKRTKRILALVLALCMLLADGGVLTASADNVLKLPSGLKTIEEDAFYGDESLETIVLPETIEKIGERAFAESSVREINLPSSLSSIADDAFQNSELSIVKAEPGTTAYTWAQEKGYLIPAPESSYSFRTIDEDTCEITGCAAGYTKLDLPETDSNGRQVVSIAAYAFQNYSQILSVEFPETLKSVGQYAFAGCSGLTEVVLPAGLESMGQYAFYQCTSLSSVASPIVWKRKNTYVEYGTFKDCPLKSFTVVGAAESIPSYTFYESEYNGLESVVIPETVTSVEDYAFYGCAALEYIGTAANGIGLALPHGVTSIGDYAFYNCSSLEGEVQYPESLKNIGIYAFGKCSGLTAVELPASLETMGNYAFNNCTSLTSITSPIVWPLPTTREGVFYYTFYGCPLKNLTIVGDTVSIPDYAFYQDQFNGLETVVIPATVTNIGRYAFYGCAALEYVGAAENGIGLALPHGVTSIGDYAFYNCSSLEGEVQFPESLKNIGIYAFGRCSGLTAVELPASLETMSDYAFNNCTSLTSVTSPIVWPLPAAKDAPFYYTFESCPLTNLTVVGDTVSIPNYAFYWAGHDQLETIVIPATVTSIGEYAFYFCTGLKYVGTAANGTGLALPHGVTSIGDYAFYNCSSLEGEVQFPENLKIIGFSAFAGCSGLTAVELPAGLETMSNYAFNNCTSLTSVTSPIVWPLRTAKEEPFYYTFAGCPLTNLTVVGNTVSIPNYAFYWAGHDQLETIVIPATVTSIGEYAFYFCTGLKYVGTAANGTGLALPHGVTSIGDYSFYNCSSLGGEVQFPESLKSIGIYAFAKCSSMTKVYIPRSVSNIGNGVFDNHHVDLVIYGHSGSTAEIWCEQNNVPFNSDLSDWCTSILGRVLLENGTALPGVAVSVYEDEQRTNLCVATSTDETGLWTCYESKPGHDYLIVLENDGYTFSKNSFRLSTGAGVTYTDIVYASKVTNAVSVSGVVTSNDGVPLEEVLVYIFAADADENDTPYATVMTNRNGEWRVNGLPADTGLVIEYYSEEYTIAPLGISLSDSTQNITAIASLKGTEDSLISFAMTASDTVAGATVHFSVAAAGFNMVQLVVDGTSYEMYPVIDGICEFDRVFHQGGRRAIRFKGTDSDGVIHLCAASYLSLTDNGPLSSVEIVPIGDHKMREAIPVRWSAVENADSYTVYLYSKYGVVWPLHQYFTDESTVTDTEITIPADTIILPGTYTVEVVASGMGYCQSSAYAEFEVYSLGEGVEISYPYDGAMYHLRDTMHTTVMISADIVGVKLLVQAPDGSVDFYSADSQGVFYPKADHIGEYILTPYYSMDKQDFTFFEADGCGKSVHVNVDVGGIELVSNAGAAQNQQDNDGIYHGEIYNFEQEAFFIIDEGSMEFIPVKVDNPVDAVRVRLFKDEKLMEIEDGMIEKDFTYKLADGLTFNVGLTAPSKSGKYKYTFVACDSGTEGSNKVELTAYVLRLNQNEEIEVDNNVFLKEATSASMKPGGDMIETLKPGQSVILKGYYGPYACVSTKLKDPSDKSSWRFVSKDGIAETTLSEVSAILTKTNDLHYQELDNSVEYNIEFPVDIAQNISEAGLKIISGAGWSCDKPGNRTASGKYCLTLRPSEISEATLYECYVYFKEKNGIRRVLNCRDSFILYNSIESDKGTLYSKKENLTLEDPLNGVNKITVVAPEEHIELMGEYSYGGKKYYVCCKDNDSLSIGVLDEETYNSEITSRSTDRPDMYGIVIACDMTDDDKNGSGSEATEANYHNAMYILSASISNADIRGTPEPPHNIEEIHKRLNDLFAEVDYNDTVYVYFLSHGMYKESEGNRLSAEKFLIGYGGQMTYKELADYQSYHGGIKVRFIIDCCYSGAFKNYIRDGSMGVFATRPNEPGQVALEKAFFVESILVPTIPVSYRYHYSYEAGSIFTMNLKNHIKKTIWCNNRTVEDILSVKSPGTEPTANPSTGDFFQNKL